MKVTKFLIVALLGVGYLPLNGADASRKRRVEVPELSEQSESSEQSEQEEPVARARAHEEQAEQQVDVALVKLQEQSDLRKDNVPSQMDFECGKLRFEKKPDDTWQRRSSASSESQPAKKRHRRLPQQAPASSALPEFY